MDLTVINTIIDYLDYAAWLVVILGVIVSAVLFALGRLREGSKKITYVLLAAFVLAFAFTILQNALGGPVVYSSIPGYQYISYLAYAGAAVSIIATAILLVKGDLREAGTYFIAAVLIIWAVNFAPTVFPSSSASSYSPYGTIILSANPTSGNCPLTFTLQGYVMPTPNQTEVVDIYAVNTSNNYVVNLTPATVNTNGEFSVSETIDQPGQWEIVAYIPGTGIYGSTAVSVNPTPNFGWNFVAAGLYDIEQFFEGLASGVLHLLNLPFMYAVMMPVYPTSPGSDPFGIGQTLYQMYQYAEGVAFGILGIFLVGNILYRLWNGVEEGISRIIIGVSKDVIAVAFVIVAAPYLYDVFADIVNTVGGELLNYGNPGVLLAEAFGVIAAGMGLGYFVPELANIGSDLAFAIFLAFALFIIRFLAIAAILVATPVLAAMWLFPPFRGAVRIFFDMILALGISGIVAAALFALLGKLATASPWLAIGLGLASPILFGFLPMVLSFTGVSGIMTQGGFFPFGRGQRKSGGAQTQGSQSQQSQSSSSTATGTATTGIGATVGTTELRSPKPMKTIEYTKDGHEVKIQQPAGPMGIVRRIRERGTGTIRRDDVIGDDLSRPPPVPRGYRVKGEKSDLSGFVIQREWSIEEKKRWALARGVAENIWAGVKMSAQRFGRKFDDWLSENGVPLRPAEHIENKIREVRLRRANRKPYKTT